MKPLEALGELYNYAHSYDDLGIEEADKLYELVEKQLKALEIVKAKDVDIYFLKRAEDYETYCFTYHSSNQITEDEFDLIKGALAND